jgi:hypothetical protein
MMVSSHSRHLTPPMYDGHCCFNHRLPASCLDGRFQASPIRNCLERLHARSGCIGLGDTSASRAGIRCMVRLVRSLFIFTVYQLSALLNLVDCVVVSSSYGRSTLLAWKWNLAASEYLQRNQTRSMRDWFNNMSTIVVSMSLLSCTKRC